MHPGWPARVGPLRVTAGRVTLRPIRLRDAATWSRLRIVNREHLEPWEPTGQAPWDDRHHVTVWPGLCSSLRSEARKGRMLPMVIELDGRYCGQITVGNIAKLGAESGFVKKLSAGDSCHLLAAPENKNGRPFRSAR